MKNIKKLLLFVLIILPCAIIMTACGGGEGGEGNNGGHNIYTASQINDKIVDFSGGYNYKQIDLSASLTKGKANEPSSGEMIDEIDTTNLSFFKTTSGGEPCFVTSISDESLDLHYVSGVSGYIYIDADNNYFYADMNDDWSDPSRYIKKGRLSEGDEIFVKKDIVTKTAINEFSGFYSISFEKEFITISSTATEVFSNNVFEIYKSEKTYEYFWDEELTDKIDLNMSTFTTGVSSYVYYCKIGSAYYAYKQYYIVDDQNYIEQPQQDNINILNNKYILREEYVELDKNYYDYIVSCLSAKNFLAKNAVQQVGGKVSWLDSYGLSENENEKALIKQIYGDSSYKYSFSAEDTEMNGENMIYISCTRSVLIDNFTIGSLDIFDFSDEDECLYQEENNVENALAEEIISGYIGKDDIILNIERKLDTRFITKNDIATTITCLTFNLTTSKIIQYTFEAPTSLGNAKNVYKDSTTYRFVNTFTNKESITKDRGEVLSYAETVPTDIPAGTTFNGWYYDQYFKSPALVNGSTIKVTGADTSLRLYAKYNNLPKITLDANGGSLNNVSASILQIVNNSIALDDFNTIIPVKAGFVFDGWYVSTDPDKDVDAIEDMERTESLTLVAKWAQQYVIKLQTNCDYSVGAYLVREGEKINDLPNFIDNPGKIFQGWYLDSECTTKVSDSGYVCVGTDKTLYAKYTDGVIIDFYTKYAEDQNFSKFARITTPKEQPQDFGKFYYELYNKYASTNILSGYEFAGFYTDEALTRPYTSYSMEDTSLYCAIRPINSSIDILFNFGRNKSNNEYDNLENYFAQSSFSSSVNLGYSVTVTNTNDRFLYNPDGIAISQIKIGTPSDYDIRFKNYYYTVEGETSIKTYKLTINGFYFEKTYNPDTGDYSFTREWNDVDSFNWQTLNEYNSGMPLWYDHDGSIRSTDIFVYVDYDITEIEVE